MKFIVSSVDESLKNIFKLQLGLADTTSWEKMVESKRATPPREISSNEWSLLKKQPFVQILGLLRKQEPGRFVNKI